jgi:hypothetical protein
MLKFNIKILLTTGIAFIGIIVCLFFVFFKAFENRNTSSLYYKLGVSLFNYNVLTVEGDERLKKDFRVE